MPSPAAGPACAVDCGDGAQFRVRRSGPSSAGLTAVLVSGMGIPLEQWAPLQVALDGHGFAAVAFDRPPMRNSSAARAAPTPHERAREILGLIRRLDLTRVIVVGHSYGGLLAIHLAHLLSSEQLLGEVLVDSTHPLQLLRSVRQRRGLPWVEQALQTAWLRSRLGFSVSPKQSVLQGLDAADSAAIAQALKDPGTWTTAIAELRAWRDEDTSYYQVGSPLWQIPTPLTVLCLQASTRTDPIHQELQEDLLVRAGGGQMVAVDELDHYEVVQAADGVHLICQAILELAATAADPGLVDVIRQGQL